MGVTENKKFIEEKWLTAANGANVEGMLDCLTDDATFIINGTTPISGTHDKTAFGEMMSKMFANRPGGQVQHNLLPLIGEGDTVVGIVCDQSTTPSGEPYDDYSIQVWRFAENGKIREVLDLVDTEMVTRMLGAMGGHPAPARVDTP